MNTCLLKKTPFNGYDRDQVIDYVTQLDKNMREMQSAYENRIADVTDALSKANACIESLHQSAAVLSKNLQDAKAETEEYKQKLKKSEQLMEKDMEILQQAKQTISEQQAELDKLREDAQLYEEVRANIDQLLAEVRQEADQIKAQAQKQAEQIVTAAKAKMQKKPEKSDLLNRVLRAKREIKGNNHDAG